MRVEHLRRCHFAPRIRGCGRRYRTGWIIVAVERLFELDGESLTRGGQKSIPDLTTSLPRGASCVAGPSGSGKSTLSRLLNRLADPVSGTVLYKGADVRERAPLELRREVCLVPQLPALLEGTVEHNIRFAGDRAGREP